MGSGDLGQVTRTVALVGLLAMAPRERARLLSSLALRSRAVRRLRRWAIAAAIASFGLLALFLVALAQLL